MNMKTHKAIMTLAAVAFVGMLAGMASAGGDEGLQRSKARAAKAAAFSAAGEYTGALSGSVTIGSVKVVIPKDAAIYRVGVGPLKPGDRVAGAHVYASGSVREGKPVASLVVVSNSSGAHDFSETTLENVEADPNRAR
jgi:hypothetical protein